MSKNINAIISDILNQEKKDVFKNDINKELSEVKKSIRNIELKINKILKIIKNNYYE